MKRKGDGQDLSPSKVEAPANVVQLDGLHSPVDLGARVEFDAAQPRDETSL